MSRWMRSIQRLWRCAGLPMLMAILSSACTSTQLQSQTSDEFGRTVRAALQAQSLPAQTPPASRVQHVELETSLGRYLQGRTGDRAPLGGQAAQRAP